MLHNHTAQQASERRRTQRLSPEITEFVHMLAALEGFLATPAAMDAPR